MHVFRWDLDKTYLQTDFDSVRGLLRSALEPAQAKRNVPGSRALLRALGQRDGTRICIISGSPTQMREVLTEKLQLDGVRVDELHLKDNLGNLRRGRLRAVREQFGYKLPLLLEGRRLLGTAVHETLFGDDAEVDALVYSVFADAIAGRLRSRDVARIMEAAGAYPEQIETALARLDACGTAAVVDRIFIHLDRGVPVSRFRPLGGRVVPVQSWYQAALVLYAAGRLDARDVVEVAREVVAAETFGAVSLAALLQDLVRRGHVRREDMERLVAEMGAEPDIELVVDRSARMLDHLGETPRYRPPERPYRIDYVALLKDFGRKVSKD